MHEQSIPFLLSFWMCGLFGDVNVATNLGVLYLIFRLYYPLGLRLVFSGQSILFLFLSTIILED